MRAARNITDSFGIKTTEDAGAAVTAPCVMGTGVLSFRSWPGAYPPGEFNACEKGVLLMGVRTSLSAANLLMLFLLMLTSLASWFALAGCNSASAHVFANTGKTGSSLAEPDDTTQARVNEAYGRLPLSFEVNQGQLPLDVKFVSRGRHQTLYLTATSALLRICSPQPAPRDDAAPDVRVESKRRDTGPLNARRTNLVMTMIGARSMPKAEGFGELPGKSNYLIGDDPKKWRSGVSNYAKVRYRSVYDGIDLVYHGEQGKLEYDFIVAPGADPTAVTVAFEGLDRMRIDARGDLLISTQLGEITQRKPVAYQDVNGVRKEVPARYAIRGKNRIGFAIGRHDARRTLVIDPVLSYSTYLGGSVAETAGGVAVDLAGNVYVAGHTESPDFPTKNPLQPPPPSLGFVGDAFVAKLNPSGTALVYSTYLGGSEFDQAVAIAVDSVGDVCVTGFTVSTNFPVVNAVQPTRGGAGFTTDAFVAKINASGSALVYSTYLGGSRSDEGRSIAADSAGSAYVTGFTTSTDFPTANPMQPALLGTSDAFVTKFNPSGSLAYSTYLGGSGGEAGYAVAVDSLGQASIAGASSSPDFPLWNALQPNFNGRTAFRSASGGSQWTAINNGIPDFDSVNALAVDPNTPSTVYAGSAGGGVFKSIDRGASWVSAGLTGLACTALEVDPRDSNTVFAAGKGVVKSTDGGLSWTLVRPEPAPSIRIDPMSSSIVYAGWLNGISKSTDGGATWRDIVVRASGTGFVANLPHSIAIDPITPTTLYVASPSNSIFKSIDNGATWRLLTNGLAFQGYNSLAIDPSATATIYAGSRSFGVFKSTNGGQNWTRSLPLPGVPVNSLVIDPVSPSTVYAGSYGANVFKTTDGGANWTQARNGLTNSFVDALAINPVNPSTLYAGTDVAGEGFVLRLNAAGSSLLYSTFLGGDETDYCTGIAVDGFGNSYVSGVTYSTNFPTANPLQPAKAGYYDGFVAKLNAIGSALVYSTYLGGSLNDEALGIALDPSGNAYITGSTFSTDFPLVSPLAGPAGNPFGNAFAVKVNNAGAVLAYSTYLGGPFNDFSISDDRGNAIAVDSLGNAYVTGETSSNQFPTTPGAFQPNLRGFANAFVVKLSVFDVCLQDDTTGALLQFNSVSGDYVFDDCRKGVRLSGKGVVLIAGCKMELRDKGIDPKRPDRDICALANPCAHTGNASVIIYSSRKTFTITDRNTANDNCVCAGS